MGIVNKRNAIIGWIVLKLGKRAAKRKAQSAAPGPRTGGIVAGAFAAVAAASGALLFWRKKRSGSASE
jgi:hypothetical protein